MKDATNHDGFIQIPEPRKHPRKGKGFAALTPAEQEECAAKLVGVVKRIGNQHRILLLAELCNGACSVGELQAKLKRSQPSISNDLIQLRNLELVTSKHSGNRRINRLNDTAKNKITALLDELLS